MGKPKNLGIADALRQAGFVRIPSNWWCTPDELSVIKRITHNHQDVISEIRERARARADDPSHDKTSWPF